MVVSRRTCSYLVMADLALFLLAAAFNDRSTTSVDGILWWIAIFGFALLIVAATAIFLRFMLSRVRRPRRTRLR